MNDQYDTMGEAGLRFFGKVSASIAHELKNVLAILNENAGLLEDLSFAAERGAAINPERLNKACQQFTKQIQRADGIIKNMSHFAHSVDEFEAEVDLYQVTELVANLAGRLAAMRKLTLQTKQPSSPVIFSGNPFLLQNLIWICLELAMGTTGAGGTLVLTPAKDDSGVALRFGQIDDLAPGFANRMPVEHNHFLTASGAKLSEDLQTQELILHLT